MAILNLYVDQQAQQFVQGFTNSLPLASFPESVIGEPLDANIFFLNQTGVSSTPYAYANNSSLPVALLIGVVAGTPNLGSFCLTDGSNVSTPIFWNYNAVQVQQAMSTVSTWTNPTVTGPIGGPWTIVNGVNGTLPVLISTLNELEPASSVIISQSATGNSTSPAVNLVRLVMNPIANQTSWTNTGSPTYAFSGTVTINALMLQQIFGTFLQGQPTLSVQLNGITLATTTLTFLNSLLPTGASFTPGPFSPSGSFIPSYTSVATLRAIPTANGAIVLSQIIPGLVSGGAVYYQLRVGGTGIQPNDYNASTNNVSWYQVL
jgi:hypothetical protein